MSGYQGIIVSNYQVVVLGALVGLGAAQFLIILFSLCLCRVLNHQSHFLFPGNAAKIFSNHIFGRAIFDCIKIDLVLPSFVFRRQDGSKTIIISDIQETKSPLLGSLLRPKKIDT